MIPIPSIPLFLPAVGYAETHYRFRFLPSFLHKPEPEILFDAPHRLGPDQRLPVVLLVKDAHMFPVDLERAEVRIMQDGETLGQRTLVHERIRLTEPWWWTIFDVELGSATGWISLSLSFTISNNGTSRTYAANNYRTASGSPLRIYRSASPLPSYPGFLMGEAHAHSNYTSDQVEYGLPLRATRYLAGGMGLGYCCITDHSYDLDDLSDSYLVNDPDLQKWRSFQVEVDALNTDGNGPVVIRGEEVSVRNAKGRNVHCLVYGDRKYHPGAGDSAEQWLRTRSELSINDLTTRVSRDAAMFGAHIAEDVPLLQRLLLGRGTWSLDDISVSRLHGVQFWNGAQDAAMHRGKEMWIRQLLRGRRSVSIAGNDAHGNFNRFLQLRIPFIALHDLDRQLFGRVRTAAFCEETDEHAIIRSLQQGRSVLTDGPMCAIYSTDGRMMIGNTMSSVDPLTIRASSSREFGPIGSVRLFQGKQGEDREVCIGEWDPASLAFQSGHLEPDPHATYVRAEVRTRDGDAYGRSHLAITNPVWLTPAS